MLAKQEVNDQRPDKKRGKAGGRDRVVSFNDNNQLSERSAGLTCSLSAIGEDCQLRCSACSFGSSLSTTARESIPSCSSSSAFTLYLIKSCSKV